MALGRKVRLSKLAREYNVGIQTIVEFLQKKNIEINDNPNTKVPAEAVALLDKEYKTDLQLKKESEKISLRSSRQKKATTEERVEDWQDDDKEEVEIKEDPIVKDEKVEKPEPKKEEFFENTKKESFKVLGKIDLDSINKPKKKAEKVEKPKEEVKETSKEKSPAAEIKEEKPKQNKPVEEPKVSKETEEVKPEPPKQEEPKKQEEKTPEKKLVTQKEDKTQEKVEAEVTSKEKEEPEETKILETEVPEVEDVKVVGKIDLSDINQRTRPARKSKAERDKERKERNKSRNTVKKQTSSRSSSQEKKEGVIKASSKKLDGPTVVGKIELPNKKDKTSSSSSSSDNKKKRRRRVQDSGRVKFGKTDNRSNPKGRVKKRITKAEVSEEDVQKQIKETLARLTSKGKSKKGAKYRREKRAAINEKIEHQKGKEQQEEKVLKVTEFVSVNELATMMDVDVTKVISACMSLGLFVSINQRLDAETLQIVAEEFGYKVEFVSVEIQEAIDLDEEEFSEEDLEDRPPIVTVMGHVDHGKTSLLDYIRSANVIAGEAGGITQHIGAYHVELSDGKNITFLDTPGHEAFTAMRARGAQVTDIAIIIIAADDDVMPQTIEAINHASAAGVPIVFAINKIDMPGADPEKIKEQLANMNYLVEDWGGKYQSQDISAKKGEGIEELLEKVLLEAELLELQANPNIRATGTIIESSLDKGRGYVATVLVESGTLEVGDIILAGQHYGHVKALFNERNKQIEGAGPAEPAILLGLDGAPQAGDKFHVLENEREARNIANKREQLAREQGLRTQKHVTLDEIGRRIAIGNFQELNLIVKGDVDGSVEALADSLIDLSTDEIQVRIIHKAVGQISESDISLAAASEAIIIGFQVRPSLSARKLAEKEEIDIRLYSIIYDAINEIKAAMEGMLSPEIKEEIIGTAEVLQTFKVSKVGTVAGCIVRDGKITRNARVRVIRDGIVIYTGNLESLKRLKDDVKEVKNGYECGLNIERFNDVKVGDFIEAFEEVEVAKTL